MLGSLASAINNSQCDDSTNHVISDNESDAAGNVNFENCDGTTAVGIDVG